MKRTLTILAVTIAAVALLGAALFLHSGFSVAQCNDVDAMEARVIEVSNLYRAQAGLSPLVETPELAQAAGIRVEECGVCFSHIRPDGSDWWTVEPAYAYGENLATGYADADRAVDAWMNSPAHMYNIMNTEFRTCGVGVKLVGSTLYFVAEYGY